MVVLPRGLGDEQRRELQRVPVIAAVPRPQKQDLNAIYRVRVDAVLRVCPLVVHYRVGIRSRTALYALYSSVTGTP